MTTMNLSKSALTTFRKSSKLETPPLPAAIANAGKKAVASVERSARGAAAASTTFVKEHPLVAAGALAGVALVVGAVAQRAMQRDPTLGETISKTIKSKTKQGIGAAAKSLTRSLK